MPDLNCTEFEALLQQLVEEHQPLGDFEDASDPHAGLWRDLRAQANACPHCRQLWNEFALLERVLPVWKEHVPAVDLADAVLSRYWEETNPKESARGSAASSSRSLPRSAWPMLLVAALALVMGFRFLFLPRPEDDLPPTVPVATENPEAAPQESRVRTEVSETKTPEGSDREPAMDWELLAQDAGSAYWALASETADSFASLSVLMPPRKPATGPTAPPEPKPQAPWTSGIGAGLKPIGQDIGRATGFLFDAIPAESPTL